MSLLHVIIIEKDGIRELFSSMPKVCEAHPEFSHSYARLQKFPFEYKGWKFTKEKINPHEQSQ
ncbi:hypothetical protein [uncultured Algoriphagus sp.]|uniref:hypothetical protein n=1 Tax=uncultured Algoriphagus sp. TaxID=417365 RepID=UPI002587C75A|nr:hypothetical protein [uncultured Algoriphagus sp.]